MRTYVTAGKIIKGVMMICNTLKSDRCPNIFLLKKVDNFFYINLMYEG
jgi:GTPase Era involved in 16S rRNA processing